MVVKLRVLVRGAVLMNRMLDTAKEYCVCCSDRSGATLVEDRKRLLAGESSRFEMYSTIGVKTNSGPAWSIAGSSILDKEKEECKRPRPLFLAPMLHSQLRMVTVMF